MTTTTTEEFAASPRILLGAMELAVALGAVIGSIGLASGTIAMGRTINHRLPLHSPVLAAALLFLIVGVPMTVGAIDTLADRTITTHRSQEAGLVLMGWIVVEVVTIRTFSILQPMFLVAGLAIFIAGTRTTHHKVRHEPRRCTVELSSEQAPNRHRQPHDSRSG